jgi:starch synthase
LDGFLRNRQAVLFGILNGVDYEEWNPLTDPLIIKKFNEEHRSGKTENKIRLQEEFGLPVDPATPLFGNIGRLVDQKGVDILLDALGEMLAEKMQFVLLGTGAPIYERAYKDLAGRFPDSASIKIGFDQALSHRIEAGCDFFLMPSRFEPCGLNQMYSLRYGTVPIVRTTGGLDDTVVDIREEPEKANGIKFSEYSSQALVKALQKALVLHDSPELFDRYRHNAMRADFSWDRTAGQYLRVYERALGR